MLHTSYYEVPYVSKVRYTHSVNASCSYKVQEDTICIHMNCLLEDVALL